ncbi:MAG: hypothetical protein ACXADF_16535 [Candidatus Thorarchaeota archaeon]|jgi:hypothetical protein
MNILFIVEGKRSEKKIYKYWVGRLLPHLSYVNDPADIGQNNYSIITGGGYPNYFHVIQNAHRDLESDNNIDVLIICIDSENKSYDEKIDDVIRFCNEECVSIDSQVHIVVQNHCLETWLMGNKKINISNAQEKKLRKYRDHYNVNLNDPENLPAIDERNIAQFTYKYLKLMLREKNIRYTKVSVQGVLNANYLNQLIKRYTSDHHINSFGKMYEILTSFNGE